jgi:hypothetical protein
MAAWYTAAMADAAPVLYAVFSSPLPGREREYEQWHDAIHVPDSLGLGVFRAVRRHAAHGVSRAAFLSLWEAEDSDVEAALSRVRPAAQALRARGRVWAVQRILFHQFVFLEAASGPLHADGARTLTCLLNCWAAPESDAAFRGWYARLAGERSGPLAAYGARAIYAAGGKTLVLLESARPAAELEALWGAALEPGLPPFGEPTPIFRAGESPQQYAEPEQVGAEQLARFRPGWVSHWNLIASRSRGATEDRCPTTHDPGSRRSRS